ncbi:hypothetical protein MVEN_02453800 [Mycena venus]|uniref:Uncharacterized protein n=1 Tax=Mycena venus TaxID=2733690 RepID=A0A8H6WWY0_9AGAR|nr:hypothetical protein MVEN_02453800 [Mycena venus]
MASTSNQRMDSAKSDRHAPANVIWQWTLTPEALASCFAQDVFDMEESGSREADFFLVGSYSLSDCETSGAIGGGCRRMKRALSIIWTTEPL